MISSVVFILSISVFQTAISGPIPGQIARDVKSDLLFVQVSPNPRQGRASTPVDFRRFKVPTGGALDLFYRYGFFSLSIRVVPRDDPGSWLIREPTANIFDPRSIQEQNVPGPNSFDKNFQMYLADDLEELLEAYFRDFKAEGVEQPHKLYTGSWRRATMAKYLGLQNEVMDADSGFVLVKLNKNRGQMRVGGNLQLLPEPQSAMNEMQIGNADSVMHFVQNYGSHYIQDIVIGDSIYQIFALHKANYDKLKSMFGRKGVVVNSNEFAPIYSAFLAPWLVRETGKIQAASGDSRVMRFLENEVQIQAQFGRYPNIFELQKNPQMLDTLESLTENSEAIISMNLASLRSLIPDIQVREYYDEIVSTQTSLWEVNL